MYFHKTLFLLTVICGALLSYGAMASSTMNTDAVKNVKRTPVTSDDDHRRLQEAAVLLAYYEIEAKKLVNGLEDGADDGEAVSKHARELLAMSESVLDSARFRLPQCDEYLAKSLAIKGSLEEISHATLEKDYHLDGALPKAPPECYHAKDLFVHPATVIVLARDDPALGEQTRQSIKAEITEVLAHTEVVRQLVLYH